MLKKSTGFSRINVRRILRTIPYAYSHEKRGSILIAQRELLRQFYLTSNVREQHSLATDASEILDSATILHLLCHLADLSLKGILDGSESEQEALLKSLYDALHDDLEHFTTVDWATLLWSISSVTCRYTLAQQPLWVQSLPQVVASVDGGRVPKYSIKELVNILVSISKLCTLQSVEEYTESIVIEFARRTKQPHVAGAFSPSDFSDIVSACASLFSPRANNSEAQDAICRVLEWSAAEVHRRCSNKRSGRADFRPRDIGPYLMAYADLNHDTPASRRMIDAVATHLVFKLKSEKYDAVKKPADMVAVLKAFIQLKHKSIVVQEVVSAFNWQLRRSTVSPTVPSRNDARAIENIQLLNTLLACQIELGFCPDSLTLHALSPLLPGFISEARPEQVAQLDALFAKLKYFPGPRVAELMLSKITL